MRTTTRSSRRAASRNSAPARAAAGLIAGAALLGAGACASPTPVEELFRPGPESHGRRAMQTRHFETPDEAELLSASAAALQDLGFQVTESAREIGFLRASKERSAREYGQEIGRTVLALVSTAGIALGSNTFVLVPVDLHQQINATLVTRPLDEAGRRHAVRVDFYRIVWKGDGQSGDQYVPPGEQRMERIDDASIYQAFFARLSKAVFLEAHTI